MDFYNKFKSFFGIPSSVPPRDFNFEEYYSNNREPGNSHSPGPGPDYNESDRDAWQDFMGMANPLEMQKIIEQHIHEMMRSFGMSDGESLFSDFFSNHPSGPSDNFAVEPPKWPGSLREQFLKPGFDHPSSSKTDSDMDGKVNINELESVMKQDEEQQQPITPYNPSAPSIHPTIPFFSQSVSTHVVVKPDGTRETTKTVHDSQGNRETIVTLSNKDSEYTIITRVDKNGEETKEETYINLSNNPEALMPNIEPGDSQSWFDIFLKK